ncbi:hypothetical protein [Sorangium sp. So ce124]|uniref:hypothetical protein n=1 Tax=Sorangium sp. So ce124 TaxID=3133280 RepID=UPI003F62BEF4
MIHKYILISSLLTALALTACVAAPEEADNETINGEYDAEESTEETALELSNLTLYPGQQATFPTWSWWGWTNVKITNESGTDWGCVSLKVWNAPSEQLCTPPGTSASVARQWAGYQLLVTNAWNVPLRVEVW